MDDSALKSEVREFWDTASCGEVYAKGSGNEQRFAEHAAVRYHLEPYIPDFARFAEGSGQDVLEVGVGMGADHLQWAKSGPRRLAGVDLTPSAEDLSTKRLVGHGFT